MASEKIIAITDENFESEVLKSDIPALVDFWAPWCGPCKMIAPIIDAVADGFSGRVKICKADVDIAVKTAAQLGIMSVPTLVVYKDGEIAAKQVGARSAEAVSEMLNGVL